MAIYKTVVNIRLTLLLCIMAFCLNISYAGENNKRLITAHPINSGERKKKNLIFASWKIQC
mgnify:CR=1 FL=1